MDYAPPAVGLDERIRALHPQLSPKHKRLARLCLRNKYFMSFASAHQAGERTGTSAATVVRFAQTLGYAGYPEMQSAIRNELPSYLRAMDRIQARLAEQQDSDGVPQSVFRTDIHNIQRTAKNLDEEILSAAVEALVKAKRILVIGAGLSTSAALFLAHSLKIIGLDARANTNEGLSLAADLAQLQKDDLLFAIGLWRYARSTVNAVSKSKNAQAKVITITDSVVSPLARVADYAFEVSIEGLSYSLSMVGLMSLLNVIIVAISYGIPEQTLCSLRSVESAYSENDLLVLE